MTKVCVKCNEERPKSEFYANHAKCKPCVREIARQYRARPEVAEQRREYERTRRRRDPKRVQTLDKWARILKLYGLTRGEYEALFFSQGSCCAICGSVGDNLRFAVDHCHETGKLRGIICFNCNTSLGKLGDNEEGLTKALNYVRGVR